MSRRPPTASHADRLKRAFRRTRMNAQRKALMTLATIVASVALFACRSAGSTTPTNSTPPAMLVANEPSLPADVPPGTRNKYRQPFASSSIWNMPLGADAQYVEARIDRTADITFDEEYWIVTDDSMPRRPVYTNGTFSSGRCATSKYEYDMPIPDEFVVPDAREGDTPNNVAAFLLPDGRTIKQMNPLSRCDAGGPVTAGWLADTEDIYGDGIAGGHGGSHLSSIGGSIRLGELTSDDPITHVLKVNLYGHRFLSQADDGYRWPATAADESALGQPEDVDSYAGDVRELRMGALLALPPGVDIDALGLKTKPAKKLAWTLQNYGAYVVDDTSWDANALDVERGVPDEFKRATGSSMQASRGSWYDDMMRIFTALAVVDDNAPSSVGGGGPRLQPLAAPIGN